MSQSFDTHSRCQWNSASYRTEQILSQQQLLCAALLEIHKGNMKPSHSEFMTLELFVKVMKLR